MRPWLLRLIVLGGLVAAGLWGWRAWFPAPEKVIRRRLVELAEAVSFGPKDGPLALLFNPDKVASLCAPDVRVNVSNFGYSEALSGRDDVRKAAALIRSSFTSLTVTFPDVLVRLAPDQQSAIVEATLRGRGSNGRDLQFVELRFAMRKIDGEWLIATAETASTLQ
jgi:hypothetical protein